MKTSWDSSFIKIALEISKHSTCCNIQVGAVLVSQKNKILSLGYNGVPSGKTHCQDYFRSQFTDEGDKAFKNYLLTKEFNEAHRKFSEENELHSEINALLHCSTRVDDTTLYVTYSPCIHCAKAIHIFRVKRCIYLYEYERDKRGISFLNENGVECEQFKEKEL
jgi:dCMP deaminase